MIETSILRILRMFPRGSTYGQLLFRLGVGGHRNDPSAILAALISLSERGEIVRKGERWLPVGRIVEGPAARPVAAGADGGATHLYAIPGVPGAAAPAKNAIDPDDRVGSAAMWTQLMGYLTETAKEIIAAAQVEIARLARRRDDPPIGHIFEASPGRAITSAALCKAVDREHKALGARDVSPCGRWAPHDLRRTMRTGLLAARVRPDIAELSIGHTKKGIVGVYDRHAFDAERQAAFEAWEARLMRIVGGQDPDSLADVVNLNGGAVFNG